VTLLAFAAVRRAACCGAFAAGRACGRHAVQQSIDIACPRGAQQQTRRSSVRRENGGTDRQTDGRPIVT